MAEKQDVIDETLKKLEKQLECSVCLKRYNQPRILSCLHSFCHECLSHFPVSVQKRDCRQVITCAICRHTTELPENGISEFQSGIFIDNLQELYEVIKSSQQTSCENCRKERSNGYCKQCSVLLCQTCIDMHNRWVPFTSHQIVGEDEATTIETVATDGSAISHQLAELKEHVLELDKKLSAFQKEQQGSLNEKPTALQEKEKAMHCMQTLIDTLNKENGQLKQQVSQMQEEGSRQQQRSASRGPRGRARGASFTFTKGPRNPALSASSESVEKQQNCPVCQLRFPRTISQVDIERHVNAHFDV